VKTYRFVVPAFMVCALFLMLVDGSQAQSSDDADRTLFDRGAGALKSSEFVQARCVMESLIDIYPDSQYVPLAKFSIADAWYAEGNFKQAELEYRDFVTFFPNRPEVAEARMRMKRIRANRKM
jgi:outer membrane protein assembly factor BamD